jgi:hypothetical protein
MRNVVIGTLVCMSPLTALLALGWLTRTMAATIRDRWDETQERPGWLLGPRGTGGITRLLGGFAANIQLGIITFAGLAALSLPFTVLWFGAWWAGWENSFNKGYEQSAVGPSVWLLGTILALPLLTHLPFALAHAAHRQKLGAFFEWRRIRSVVASAGWRVPWLALLSVALAVPFFGLRALPVFVEEMVPGFADMTPEGQLRVAGIFDWVSAGYAFLILLFLRHRAAVAYALAAPRAAAGRSAGMWQGHQAQSIEPLGRMPSRFASAVWLLIACIIWFGLPALIVMGQFMNYKPALWLTHPVFLLPWAG